MARTMTPAANPAPLSQATLLHARIRDEIIYGVLAPGAKLKIEALQDRYRTGSTPLREALTLLAASGLVDRLEQRGFRVADVSLSAFEELLWTRCFAEERAVREAIAHGDPAWEGRVVLSLHHLAKSSESMAAADGPDNAGWEDHHRSFHAAILSGCRSRPLLRFCAQLYDENQRYRYIARLTPHARAGALQEHRRIGEAVLARQADLSAQRLSDHYRRTGMLLRQQLSDQPAPALPAKRRDPHTPIPGDPDAHLPVR